MSEPAAAPAPSPGTPPAAAPPAGAPPAAAPPVRIGLVGAGFIARWMMEAIAVVPGAQAVAVASAHPERAEAFAAAHSIARSYAGLPQMLEGGRRAGAGIDLIHIGSPNALHAEQAIAALDAGYHVLVEKPFALHPRQAEEMIAAARRNDRFLMEGWLTAFEPGARAVRRALPDLLADGPGPHRALLVKEQFSSRMAAYRAGGLPPAFDPAAGGGSLMDLGVYPVSMAVHLFGEPARVRATGRLLDSGADSHGVVVLEYETLPDGRATDLEVVCLHSKTSRGAAPSSIASDNLALSMDDVQWPRRIALTGPQGEQDLSVDSDGPVLARELAEVCRLVACGRRESDLHPLEASLACVRVLARAREQVGVRLPGDE